MEPVLALNYPVPMFDELLGLFGSGSEPGSIPKSVLALLVLKNPQFLPNFYETLGK